MNDTTKPKTISISNWDKWQTFRKDRGTPSWIKVHRSLFSNPEWSVLSDSEKGQLLSIWLLAADKNGTVPLEPKLIQKMCMLDDAPNINRFIDLGFLLPSGNHVVTSRPADGDQVVAQSREEESREEESREEEIVIPSRPVKPVTINYTQEFLLFWKEYPSSRRGNKKRAFANWKKIDPSLYALIINHVTQRKTEDTNWLKEGGAFIIHAEGFLSGDRWEDSWSVDSGLSEKTEVGLRRLKNMNWGD
jgi:hypothetical protein